MVKQQNFMCGGESNNKLVILPAFGISLAGFVLVVMGQSARAVLYTANYTRHMLELMKEY